MTSRTPDNHGQIATPSAEKTVLAQMQDGVRNGVSWVRRNVKKVGKTVGVSTLVVGATAAALEWTGEEEDITWGQDKGFGSSVYLDASGMNGEAFFAKDPIAPDIYVARKTNGIWGQEAPLLETAAAESSPTIYFNNDPPSFVFSKSVSGGKQVFVGDIDLAANPPALSNVQQKTSKIGHQYGYFSADQKSGVIFLVDNQVVSKVAFGDWANIQPVQGITTTNHFGVAYVKDDEGKRKLLVAAPDCPDPQGLHDICAYDLDDNNIASNLQTLAAAFPESDLSSVNTAAFEWAPNVADHGGNPGSFNWTRGQVDNAKILGIKMKAVDPGTGGAGGEAGAGGGNSTSTTSGNPDTTTTTSTSTGSTGAGGGPQNECETVIATNLGGEGECTADCVELDGKNVRMLDAVGGEDLACEYDILDANDESASILSTLGQGRWIAFGEGKFTPDFQNQEIPFTQITFDWDHRLDMAPEGFDAIVLPVTITVKNEETGEMTTKNVGNVVIGAVGTQMLGDWDPIDLVEVIEHGEWGLASDMVEGELDFSAVSTKGTKLSLTFVGSNGRLLEGDSGYVTNGDVGPLLANIDDEPPIEEPKPVEPPIEDDPNCGKCEVGKGSNPKDVVGYVAAALLLAAATGRRRKGQKRAA